MLRYLCLLALLPALAYGQGAVGTPVRQGGPARVSSLTSSGAVSGTTGTFSGGVTGASLVATGPVLWEDANTLTHVYFNGSALVDTKSLGWTMVGTVPQVAAVPPSATSPGSPAMAGPFSDSNYYKFGTGNDALDTPLAGDFMIVAIVKPTTLTSSPVIFTNGHYNQAGVYAYLGSTGLASIVQSTSGSDIAVASWSTVSTATAALGQLSVICVGANGANILAGLNGTPTNTGSAVARTAGTGYTAMIGRSDSANGALDGYLVELLITSTPISHAACARHVAKVFGSY